MRREVTVMNSAIFLNQMHPGARVLLKVCELVRIQSVANEAGNQIVSLNGSVQFASLSLWERAGGEGLARQVRNNSQGFSPFSRRAVWAQALTPTLSQRETESNCNTTLPCRFLAILCATLRLRV